MSNKSSYIKDHLETFLEHGVHIPTATITVDYNVDEESLEDFKKKFYFLENLIAKGSSSIPPEITLLLNSGGGCVVAGLAMYDRIKRSTCDVKIVVEGEASSMGAIILQAGTIRQISTNSCVMIHDGERSLEGHKKNHKAWGAFYDEMDNRCKEILFARVREKNPDYRRNMLTKDLEFDKVFTAQQALEYGLVDEILE